MKKALPIVAFVIVSGVFLLLLSYWVTNEYSRIEARANQSQQVSEPVTAQTLLSAINVERAKAGVAPLAVDEKLSQSAQWRATNMAVNKDFGHFDKDGNNIGLDYLNSLQPACAYISENLVWEDDLSSNLTEQEIIDSWLQSESHRDAMLNPKYTSTGIGITDITAVQHFCQP